MSSLIDQFFETLKNHKTPTRVYRKLQLIKLISHGMKTSNSSTKSHALGDVFGNKPEPKG